MAAVTQDRPTRFGLVTGLTFVGAVVVALVVRGSAVVGIAAQLLGFRRRRGKGSFEHRFRSLEIAFHMRGRQ